MRPYFEKIAGGVAQGVHSEFKPLYHIHKKRTCPVFFPPKKGNKKGSLVVKHFSTIYKALNTIPRNSS
jgi:hypothetical protein